MKYFFLLSVVFCVLFSCSSGTMPNDEEVPEGVIDTTTFALIITDMHIADAGSKFKMFPDNRKIDQKYSLNLGVLKNYGVTKAQWDSTMNYYASRPEKLNDIYSHVLDILSEKQAKIKEIPDSAVIK